MVNQEKPSGCNSMKIDMKPTCSRRWPTEEEFFVLLAVEILTLALVVMVVEVLVEENQELEVKEQEELTQELLEDMPKDLVEMLHLKNLEKKELNLVR
jgi:heme exporter protein D